jgi:hypothetical protein
MYSIGNIGTLVQYVEVLATCLAYHTWIALVVGNVITDLFPQMTEYMCTSGKVQTGKVRTS